MPVRRRKAVHETRVGLCYDRTTEHLLEEGVVGHWGRPWHQESRRLRALEAYSEVSVGQSRKQAHNHLPVLSVEFRKVLDEVCDQLRAAIQECIFNYLRAIEHCAEPIVFGV